MPCFWRMIFSCETKIWPTLYNFWLQLWPTIFLLTKSVKSLKIKSGKSLEIYFQICVGTLVKIIQTGA